MSWRVLTVLRVNEITARTFASSRPARADITLTVDGKEVTVPQGELCILHESTSRVHFTRALHECTSREHFTSALHECRKLTESDQAPR